MDSYFGCSRGVSKSVQAQFNGIQTVMVLTLTLIILQERALFWLARANKSLQVKPLKRNMWIPNAASCLWSPILSAAIRAPANTRPK